MLRTKYLAALPARLPCSFAARTPLGRMKIDEATLDRIAELARLDYGKPEARTAILADMERVISFVEKLNEVDTTGVEPLIFMTDEENVLRDDVSELTITKKEALQNAPVKDSDYFKVPRVVDKG